MNYQMIWFSEMIKRTLFFLFFLSATFSLAQNIPPKSNSLVNDYAGILSAEEKASLEQKLVAFNDSTSTQIAVVIIKNLEGYPVSDYAYELARSWGIGQKGKNNGLLLLASMEDHKINISTGYGAEGAVPDAIAKRIITQHIRPAFKEGRFYDGLNAGTDQLMLYMRGEYKSEKQEAEPKFPFFLIFIIGFIIFLVLFSKISRARRYSAANGVPFWIAWTLMNSMSGRGRWNDFSSGSGSFGGWGGGSSGGGGFGGFGGGGFGGGGASGDW